MFIVRVLLFPFAVLYDMITRVRNRLYDLRLRPSVQFEVPVIGVGNLAVGGTGKTPMVEYIVRLLSSRHKLVTLSRGYGRKTRGFRMAGLQDTAATIGDEPMQFYKKFSSHGVGVAVAEERALAVPFILNSQADTAVIVMDDVFQHRSVRPALTILLTDVNHPFYSDFLLPAGRLREARQGAARADVIVVTKCPLSLAEEEMMEAEHRVRRYADCPIFFSGIRYGQPVPFGNSNRPPQEKVILVTGIADAALLKDYVSRNYTIVEHVEFNDHHDYTVEDVKKLEAIFKKEKDVSILTTEKDMVKIDVSGFQPIIKNLPFFYIPIEVVFIKNGEDFDTLVENLLKSA